MTTLYHPLSGLLAETVYFVHFRVKRTPSGPSGLSDELRVEIVDAIDGSVTTDPAGTSNSLVIDAKAIATAAHESKWFSFRLRRTTTQPVYLRLRISSPLAADAALDIDEMAVAAGRERYKGGRKAALRKRSCWWCQFNSNMMPRHGLGPPKNVRSTQFAGAYILISL